LCTTIVVWGQVGLTFEGGELETMRTYVHKHKCLPCESKVLRILAWKKVNTDTRALWASRFVEWGFDGVHLNRGRNHGDCWHLVLCVLAKAWQNSPSRGGKRTENPMWGTHCVCLDIIFLFISLARCFLCVLCLLLSTLEFRVVQYNQKLEVPFKPKSQVLLQTPPLHSFPRQCNRTKLSQRNGNKQDKERNKEHRIWPKEWIVLNPPSSYVPKKSRSRRTCKKHVPFATIDNRTCPRL
jgi:hypothetical protein